MANRKVSIDFDEKQLGRWTIVDKELQPLLGLEAPQLFDAVVELDAYGGGFKGLVKLWEPAFTTMGGRPRAWSRWGRHGYDVSEWFCDWHETQFFPSRGFFKVRCAKTHASMIDICGQEILRALTVSMARRGDFEEIEFRIIGNPTNGRLVNHQFEEAIRSVVSRGLANRSEAVISLLSSVGQKAAVDLSEDKMAELITYFWTTEDYESAEPGLRWILLSALNSAFKSLLKPVELIKHQENQKRLIRGAFDFYRRSIQAEGSGSQAVVVNGVEFLASTISQLMNVASSSSPCDLLSFKELQSLLKELSSRLNEGFPWPPSHSLVASLESAIKRGLPLTKSEGSVLWALCGRENTPEDSSVAEQALVHALSRAVNGGSGRVGLSLIGLVQTAVSLNLKGLITTRNFQGYPMLFHATTMNDNDLARFLHQCGAETRWEDGIRMMTSFLEVARRRNKPLIRLFVPFGTDESKGELAARLLNKQNLFKGVKGVKGLSNVDMDLTIIEARKREWGIDVRDGEGRTPLSFAAKNGCFDLVEKLLKNGANPELQDHDQRYTPLLWAVWGCERATEGRWLQVVRRLQYSIAIRALKKADWTPGILDVLDSECNVGLIRRFLFLDRDSDNDVVSNDWDTWHDPFANPALGYVSKTESDVLNIICEETRRVANIPDSGMDRPFGLAVLFGYLGLMKQLYFHADRRLGDHKGRTPLCWAAESGQTEVVKLLISDMDGHILDQNRQSHDSPLTLAAKAGISKS